MIRPPGHLLENSHDAQSSSVPWLPGDRSLLLCLYRRGKEWKTESHLCPQN